MNLDFKALRPSYPLPPYPPYHTGPYLEEYFYDFYLKNKSKFDNTGKTLIPVFWTSLYLANYSNNTIQYYIDNLPKDRKYFTISQFDDGISQTLPIDTINFVAGGNMSGIPIPLICSPIPQQYISQEEKDIFCSFVGTYVNDEKYKCRIELYKQFNKHSEYYFSSPRHWERVVPEDKFQEFISTTKRSTFTLCPRGYGKQSFRLYEAIQLSSIPVFVYDDRFLPFENFIDWSSFCVLIHESEIPDLNNRLKSISPIQQEQMLKTGKEIYINHFTLEGMSNSILQTLINKNE
jgi:hypothetical protein